MLLEAKERRRVENAKDFVREFGLEDEFEILMNEPVEEWEPGTGTSDGEIIEKFLDCREGYYFIKYHPENLGWFEIWKVEVPEEPLD